MPCTVFLLSVYTPTARSFKLLLNAYMINIFILASIFSYHLQISTLKCRIMSYFVEFCRILSKAMYIVYNIIVSMYIAYIIIVSMYTIYFLLCIQYFFLIHLTRYIIYVLRTLFLIHIYPYLSTINMKKIIFLFFT